MKQEPVWTTLTSGDMHFEVDVIEGWMANPESATRLLLHADPQTLADSEIKGDEVPAVLIELGEPAEQGREWFQQFVKGVLPELQGLDGFEYISSEQYRRDEDWADVYVLRARHRRPDGVVVTRLAAWIWLTSYRLYEVACVTLQAHEERDMPIFERMVKSLRFSFPKPGETVTK